MTFKQHTIESLVPTDGGRLKIAMIGQKGMPTQFWWS